MKTIKYTMKNIIDGRGLSKQIQTSLKTKINELQEQYNTCEKPGLAVVLVGNRKDSETYVRMKQRAAKRIGIYCQVFRHDTDVTEKELLYTISTINQHKFIHGIIVQLPLPSHIDTTKIMTKISIQKDVDGFHALNIGKLALDGYDPTFMPCTPRGIMEMLEYYKITVTGKHVVILGKSNIVGLPLSLMMMNKNATVTICNSETQNEEEITKTADILISAVGIPEMVKAHWIKEDAVVIDVGINTIPDRTSKHGHKLVGDVDFKNVHKKTSLITPVPGGVGPMTVTMLLKATVESYQHTLQTSNSINIYQ